MVNVLWEQMFCIVDFIKMYMFYMVELLVDCVWNFMCYNLEVYDQFVCVKVEIGEIVNNFQRILLEVLYLVGYVGVLG